MSQVQLITGVERRRHWSDAEKKAVLARAFAPGAMVTEVSRQLDINTGLIYRWRREFQEASAGFAEVVVSSLSGGGLDNRSSVIEVAIGSNAKIQIFASAPSELAAAVVKALAGR